MVCPACFIQNLYTSIQLIDFIEIERIGQLWFSIESSVFGMRNRIGQNHIRHIDTFYRFNG